MAVTASPVTHYRLHEALNNRLHYIYLQAQLLSDFLQPQPYSER